MEKCKDCDKVVQDPNFNCEDCLKDLAKDYDKRCPVCQMLHNAKILDSNNHRHCDLCGELYYKPFGRGEIEKLLADDEHRKIFTAYVRERWQKTHQPIDINPQMIERVLKDRGVLE